MAYSKEERERNKILLLATLNYLLEYHSQDMVFDDYSPSKQWYLQEIDQTHLNIKRYRSEWIEKRLRMHTGILRSRFDIGLNDYIKANTKYDFDLYEQFKEQALEIIKKGNVTDNDVYPIENYLKAYEHRPEEEQNVSVIKTLLAVHQAKINKWIESGKVVMVKGVVVSQGKKAWNFNEEEYEEYIKEYNKKWLLSEEIAPNGRNKLRVQFNGKGKYAFTYVNISLAGGEGSVYGVMAEKLPIKAYWKDDHHVIIETKDSYRESCKYKTVSSYGEVITIEYRNC